MMRAHVWVLLGLLVGCGENGGGAEWPQFPEPGEWGESCPQGERVGLFEVATYDANAYSSVVGVVTAGVNPVSVYHPVEGADGGECKVLQRFNPFCDPPCEVGEICTEEETCAPFPGNMNVGGVWISGLEKRVALTPDASRNYYDVDLPHPVFTQDSTVQLYADGGEAETFSLDGHGVTPIEADLAWVVRPGQPLEVTWTPADDPARIWLSFNVDQHGNSPMTAFCDVEDTGAVTVSAALVDALIANGVSGVATGIIRRRTVDSVRIAEGCVELLVYSHLRGMLTTEVGN